MQALQYKLCPYTPPPLKVFVGRKFKFTFLAWLSRLFTVRSSPASRCLAAMYACSGALIVIASATAAVPCCHRHLLYLSSSLLPRRHGSSISALPKCPLCKDSCFWCLWLPVLCQALDMLLPWPLLAFFRLVLFYRNILHYYFFFFPRDHACVDWFFSGPPVHR